MTEHLSRRSFLTALASVGAASWGIRDLLAAEDRSAGVTPKRVDKLLEQPLLTVAHCCDPQLGFGQEKDAYRRDLARLEKELELINDIKPDVLFFGGDMCHQHAELKKDWPRLLKGIKVPYLAAVGNHDIPDPVKRADVDVFCEVFGAEYAAMNVNGWKVIVVNSQYCRETKETELYEEQVEWLQNELKDAKDKGTPVVLGSHVPPFVKSIEEKDEYFNFPTKIRKNYLDYALDFGVRFYLAGHTHTTLYREYRGIPILNGETTSNNFDSHPFGFRLLKIDANMNFEWNFIGLEG